MGVDLMAHQSLYSTLRLNRVCIRALVKTQCTYVGDIGCHFRHTLLVRVVISNRFIDPVCCWRHRVLHMLFYQTDNCILCSGQTTSSACVCVCLTCNRSYAPVDTTGCVAFKSVYHTSIYNFFKTLQGGLRSVLIRLPTVDCTDYTVVYRTCL